MVYTMLHSVEVFVYMYMYVWCSEFRFGVLATDNSVSRMGMYAVRTYNIKGALTLGHC